MTEISFHSSVPDKIAYAGRLVRKAVQSGTRVVVHGSEATVGLLDDCLWCVHSTDFIAHCRADAGAAALAFSPVVLCHTCSDAPHRDVLVNLNAEVPAEFSEFDRLFEIVTADYADRRAARQRWKFYTDRGYPVAHHDFAASGARP